MRKIRRSGAIFSFIIYYYYFSVDSVISAAMILFEKTKPIYSFCVMRYAYCVMEVEKTNPIFRRANQCKFLYEGKLWQDTGLWPPKNKANQSRSPAFGRKSEILSTKSETDGMESK